MKRLMNLLRGMVILCITGPFPERLMNLCAQENIDFWALEWLDSHTVRMTTRRRTLARLEELGFWVRFVQAPGLRRGEFRIHRA